MRLMRKGKLYKPDGTPIPKKLKSPKETFDILADLYFEHVKSAEKQSRVPYVAIPDNLPISPGQRTPRFTELKSPSPPNTSDVIAYVNDIFYSLRILPSIEFERHETIGPYVPPLLPDRSPYPNLHNSGLIQSRPGAPLRALPGWKRLQLSNVTSVSEFEEYIYSLAFHRKVSIKYGTEMVRALSDPKYTKFLSITSFRYAITSLLDRASDIYSARRLGEIMTHRGIPLDIYIYNEFLMGALRVENLRMFANILRDILGRHDIQADSTTWNIALQMGIKIKSLNWVHSVLEVMKSRGIPLDHDALKATFLALKEVVSADVLKQYYFDYYAHYPFVLWKPFHVVLRAVGKEQGIDNAWKLLLQVSEKAFPVDASVSLFMIICKHHNDYERAWEMIGDFRSMWQRAPVASTIARLFVWACELEQFSDAILLWSWAKLRHDRWPIHRKMFLAARIFEREYGVAILTSELDGAQVKYNWLLATTGSRNKDPFHLVPRSQRQHVELMRARKHSELSKDDPRLLSEEERLWTKIQQTYNAAVKAGVWKPKPAPRIPFGQQPNASKTWKTIKPVSRLLSRENFRTKEMTGVWELVQRGVIKIPGNTEVEGIDEIPEASEL
jgi:hypothetical protein